MDYIKEILETIDKVKQIRNQFAYDNTNTPENDDVYSELTSCIIALRHAKKVLTESEGITSSEDRNKDNLNKIFNSKPIKSPTYQFVAEFDGQYQPRVLDYMFKNGSPSWTDLNEDWSNGKMFTEQELPKVAKQLERYYADRSEGSDDIEIVRDNGDSVYLGEFLQEGSFDKAWKRVEDDWLNDTMTK